jgi:hypothetical protein
MLEPGFQSDRSLSQLGGGSSDNGRFPELYTSDSCHNGTTTRRPGAAPAKWIRRWRWIHVLSSG